MIRMIENHNFLMLFFLTLEEQNRVTAQAKRKFSLLSHTPANRNECPCCKHFLTTPANTSILSLSIKNQNFKYVTLTRAPSQPVALLFVVVCCLLLFVVVCCCCCVCCLLFVVVVDDDDDVGSVVWCGWTSKSGRNIVCFSHFDLKFASHNSSLHFFDIPASKSAPDLQRIVHLDFEIRFVPQIRALDQHLSFQKCFGPEAFCTFWLRNVLRKHQHPNLLLYLSQHPDLQGVLCILALKCALRRNAVRFLNISTSESAPNPLCFFRFLLHGSTSQSAQSMRCFWHFDLEFIFAPQRRTNFDLISPDGSAPAALASVLFDHSGKTECFGTFFFTHLHLPSSGFFSSFFFLSLLWLFPPLSYHLPMLSGVWLPNFLRLVHVHASLRQAMSRFCSSARCRVSDVASTTKSCPAGGGSWENRCSTNGNLETR